MGDVGQTADSAATLQHLVASAPQSILDVGDISYAGGPGTRLLANVGMPCPALSRRLTVTCSNRSWVQGSSMTPPCLLLIAGRLAVKSQLRGAAGEPKA